MTLAEREVEHLGESVIDIVQLALREVRSYGDDRDSWLLWFPHVDQAKLVRQVDFAKVIPPPLRFGCVKRMAQPLP